MKKNRADVSVFIFLMGILFLSACATVRVPSLVTVLVEPTAEKGFIDRRDRSFTRQKTVSMEVLNPILQRAEWTDRSVIHKGVFGLRYPNGTMVKIATGFHFFYVEGVPGHFEIRAEDVPLFRNVIEAL